MRGMGGGVTWDYGAQASHTAACGRLVARGNAGLASKDPSMCRCTGYKQVTDSAMAVAAEMRGEWFFNS